MAKNITTGSRSFRLNKSEAWKIGKVFIWTVATAFVAGLLALVDAIEFPIQYLWVAPALNTMLVTLYELLKDNSKANK